MEFKVLSEQQLQFIQFKARQIFQELKEEQQWNNFCKKNHVELPSLKNKPEEKEKSDVAIQVYTPKPKIIYRAPQFSKEKTLKQEISQRSIRNDKHVVEPNVHDINIIKEKLSSLESFIHDLKCTQQFVKKQELNIENEISKGVPVAQAYVDRSEIIQNALISVLKKAPTEQIAPWKLKNVNSGYLIPESLKVQRLISRQAYEKSNPPKPTAKNRCLSKNVVNAQDPRNKKSKTNLKSAFKRESTTKVIVPENHKCNSKEKVVKIASEDTISKSEDNIEIKQTNEDEINELLKKVKEIHSIDNSIQERLDALKKSVEPSHMPDPVSRSNEEKESIRTCLEYLKSSMFVNKKEEEKEPLQNVTLPTNPILVDHHDPIPEQLSNDFEANTNPSANDGKIKLEITPNTLRSIHHHRKLFRRYLRNTAHQAVDTFNPWTLMNNISDHIVSDCIEEVAYELEKIPSSFVSDLYNREFAQSIL